MMEAETATPEMELVGQTEMAKRAGEQPNRPARNGPGWPGRTKTTNAMTGQADNHKHRRKTKTTRAAGQRAERGSMD